MKIARYLVTKKSEETRLSILGNKYAGKIEARLNANGIESSYGRAGYLDGYIIDSGKTRPGSELDRIASINPEEANAEHATAALKERYGVDVTFRRDGKFFVSAKDLNYTTSHGLVKDILGENGYSELGTTLRARIMGKKAGISWHPLKILDRKIITAIDAQLTKWETARDEGLNKGVSQDITANVPPKEDANGHPQAEDPGATSTKAATEETLKLAADADKGLTSNPTPTEGGPFSALSGHIATKITGGMAAAIGLACTIKGIADNIEQIKHTQIILPLMRMGMQAIAVGNQIMAGKDVDMSELAVLSKQLNSDKTGSWVNARSIQAEQGQPLTGPDIRAEAKVAPGGNMVSQIANSIPGLDTVCKAASSTAGQVGSFAIDVISGPGSALAGLAFGSFVGPKLVDGLTHWLAGHPIDINVAGADYGNYINYGARLAANETAISGGGVKLSSVASAELKADQQSADKHTESQKSFAARIANPYDGNSLISRVMDKQNPNLGNNISSTASSLLSLKSVFSSLPKLFSSLLISGKARAATTSSYDYGFPEYGFSINDLNNPAVSNPFDNGTIVSGLLKGPSGDDYISRVKGCFGMNLDKEGTVTPGDKSLSYQSIDQAKINDTTSANCTDGSLEWLRVRFYVLDTETMEAAACYEGENQSCNNLGFGSSSAAAPASNAGNSNIAVFGDSITVGMRDYGNLADKLTAQGWSVIKPIDAVGGKPLKWGIDDIKTRTDLVNAGTIVINLGTNDGGTADDTFAKQVDDMMTAVKVVAPNAKVKWTNLYGKGQLCALICVDLPKKFGELNQILQDKSTKDGFTIIPWATSDVAPKLVGNNDVHPSGHFPEMTDYIVSQIGAAPK
jgi:hypothetical protein